MEPNQTSAYKFIVNKFKILLKFQLVLNVQLQITYLLT